jgi:hypothetical protein
MKLKELSQKPKLIKLTINAPDIVKKYGDELEFHVYDRQPIDIFTKLANAGENNVGDMVEFMHELILDEDGNPITENGEILPIDVTTEAIRLVSETLGK